MTAGLAGRLVSFLGGACAGQNPCVACCEEPFPTTPDSASSSSSSGRSLANQRKVGLGLGIVRRAAKERRNAPASALYGTAGDMGPLVALLQSLPKMDKVTMSGRCTEQTRGMEMFMQSQVGMANIPGKFFVPGVRAFDLKEPLGCLPGATELAFSSQETGAACFRMSIGEVLEWQESFCTYYAADVYKGEEGLEVLRRSLCGCSRDGEEAFLMKFAVRISKNPVLMRFDGKVIDRAVGEGASGRIHLVSVCGIDFAARSHDRDDISTYITNWRQVYQLREDGTPVIHRGRDFVPTGKMASLDLTRCLQDLKKMARLRLRAQDAMGIQVVVEVGIGLGVFAGDAVGIGGTVRTLSAAAVKQVLEEEKFTNIKLVVFSLPIFRANDNYEYFQKVFGNRQDPYKGGTPVLLMDQDMHAVAQTAAEAGFSVGELNPADSHGVFGEYWQNQGPGTEEKLALTTCGLLTQHHAVNPAVTDTARYHALDLSAPA